MRVVEWWTCNVFFRNLHIKEKGTILFLSEKNMNNNGYSLIDLPPEVYWFEIGSYMNKPRDYWAMCLVSSYLFRMDYFENECFLENALKHVSVTTNDHLTDCARSMAHILIVRNQYHCNRDIEIFTQKAHLHKKRLWALNLCDTSISNLNPIGEYLTNLRSLNLSCTNVCYLKGIEKLINLDDLDISITKVHNILPLKKLKLKTLNLRATAVTDVSPLEHITTLEYLNLSRTRSLKIFSSLRVLVNLKRLELDGSYIRSLSVLSKLVHLTHMSLRFLDNVTNVSSLRHLTLLQYLDITGSKLFHVNDLVQCKNLKKLTTSKYLPYGLSYNISYCQLSSINILKLRGVIHRIGGI